MSAPYPFTSGGFLGDLGKRTGIPTESDFELQRIEVVDYLRKEGLDDEHLRNVIAFMSMELRALKSVVIKLTHAGESAMPLLVDAVVEVEANIDSFVSENLKFTEVIATAAVRHGTNIGRKQTAKNAGKASAQAWDEIRKFAFAQYDIGDWGSCLQARDAIWPKVKAESIRLNRPMTDTRGPKTLYDWLLKHKNTR